MTSFAALGLAAPLLDALAAAGLAEPTPIQEAAIGPAIDGRDVLGIAQTGTGKTAAFALPILHRILADRRRPAPRTARALVLCPTRELAAQIVAVFESLGGPSGLRCVPVVGGAPKGRQVKSLLHGTDVAVATPGRLLDLIRDRAFEGGGTATLVLDEADQMLDLGFGPDVQAIADCIPPARQTLLFSATVPPPIEQLARRMLRKPLRLAATPSATAADRVKQRVIFVEAARKRDRLAALLRAGQQIGRMTRVLVFTRTKGGADRVVQHLETVGESVAVLHGDRTQDQRNRALLAFRAGRVRTLVATDVAARGIDVEGITHVINFDLPNVPETYVHRIGRTARAGRAGFAISFCDSSERGYLRAIENLLGTRLRIDERDEEDAA